MLDPLWSWDAGGSHPFVLSDPSSGAPAGRYTGITATAEGVRPGFVFVALSKQSLDAANSFFPPADADAVKTAIRAGATAVVAEPGFLSALIEDAAAPLDLYRVTDSLSFLKRLAGWRRSLMSGDMVLITGSAGKSTTTDILRCILHADGRDHIVSAHYRSGLVGACETLLESQGSERYCVLETGIDRPGQMDERVGFFRPTIAAVTMIGLNHIVNYEDQRQIASEKLLAYGGEDCRTAVLNLDDALCVSNFVKRPGQRVIGFSTHHGQDSRCDEVVSVASAEGKAELAIDGRVEGAVLFALHGTHNRSNAACAVATARAMRIPLPAILTGLASCRPLQARTELVYLDPDTVLVCDFWNSSPTSLLASLDAVREIKSSTDTRRMVLVLGDMHALGGGSDDFHLNMLPHIASVAPDEVVLVGPRMKVLAGAITRAGYRFRLSHRETKEDALPDVLSAIRPGDCVLLKASGGMHFHFFAEALQRHWGAAQNGGWSPRSLVTGQNS